MAFRTCFHVMDDLAVLERPRPRLRGLASRLVPVDLPLTLSRLCALPREVVPHKIRRFQQGRHYLHTQLLSGEERRYGRALASNVGAIVAYVAPRSCVAIY